MNKPLVSVLMITYNHENFIREAIEGVLMQKTVFSIELIIGEDCSTDNTRKIVVEYAEKYPKVIRPLLSENNLGMMKNFIETMQAASGKYIAICEGDDYWTDPLKLQKQVDFLEANEEYSMCFHKSKVLNQNTSGFIFEQPNINHNKTYTINDLFLGNPIATASVIFKREFIKSIPDWFSKVPFGDYALYLIILDRSKQNAIYLSDVMSVYRLHSGGVHGSAHFSNVGYVKAYKQHVNFWKVISENYLSDYKKEINNAIVNANTNVLNYMLYDGKLNDALVWNMKFLFSTKFNYFKINTKLFKKIIKLTLKSIIKRF